MKHTTLTPKSTLILSKELLSQISFLHHKIKGDEWSGLIFYKIESGSIEDPANLVIRVERMYLMDIGNGTYTEFKPDETIIDFYDNYPDCEKIKWGMIHTHHSMQAFFSGTDMSELETNAGPHQFYLSLIVNYLNGGSFCAKLAMIVDVKIKSEFTFNNNIGIKVPENESVEKQLFTIDCEIKYEQDTFDLNRYEAVLASKKQQSYNRHSTSYNLNESFDRFKPNNYLGQSSGKKDAYIPKTASELDSYLAKALSLDIHTDEKLYNVLLNIENIRKQNKDEFDSIYYDQVEMGLDQTYVSHFNEWLSAKDESKFFKQCILYLDKFRLNNFSIYDKIIDLFELYIDVPQFELSNMKKESLKPDNDKKGKKGKSSGIQTKIHSFSCLDDEIKKMDKLLIINGKSTSI